MEKKNVLVVGCNGRMGKLVCSCIEKSESFQVVAGYDLEVVEKDGFKIFNDVKDLPSNIDIIIDFSLPDATMRISQWACEEKIPMVIATTGLTDEQMNDLKQYSCEIPIFYSANMSYKIYLITKMLQYIAPFLQDCDIEIFEAHHRKKKDSPSGTAKNVLFSALNESMNNMFEMEYGRKGLRSENEIGIASLRGGSTPGIHSVYFFGENDDICITHQAHSPEIFAEGSLKAAEFLVNADVGFYSMSDIDA